MFEPLFTVNVKFDGFNIMLLIFCLFVLGFPGGFGFLVGLLIGNYLLKDEDITKE
jgi:hypothetical protein